MEDYLKAILRLSDAGGVARVRDIAVAVGVTPPTVSSTVGSLTRMGYVNYRPYEVITLTPAGAEIARRINRRHELLSRLFRVALGVQDEIADADACRVEHGLSRETVDRLVAFMEFIECCPRAGPGWIEHFRKSCRRKIRPKRCVDCIGSWLPGAREKLPARGPKAVDRRTSRRGGKRT